jgi:hypothetical protein
MTKFRVTTTRMIPNWYIPGVEPFYQGLFFGIFNVQKCSNTRAMP